MTFNVLYEPWLPVRWRNGDPPSEVGLYDALCKAHEIIEIATDNPLETASLNRLLAALVASIFADLSNKRFWYQTWQKGYFDADRCDSYFKEYADHFDLLSPIRPFYGHPNPDKEKISPLTRLQHDTASGNNETLFSHDLDNCPQPMTLASAARAIVCTQAYALSGGNAKPFNLSQAPLVKGVMFWLRGQSGQKTKLFESILLNIPPIKEVWGWYQEEDVAAWATKIPPKAKMRDILGLCDLLSFQSRRIQLITNEESQAVGVRYNQGCKIEKMPFHDPHMAYREKKEEIVPFQSEMGRALWRDSSLFLMARVKRAIDHAPRTFEWLSQPAVLRSLNLRQDAALQTDVFALIYDKNNTAKVELVIYERISFFPKFIGKESHWKSLNEILEIAENWNTKLKRASEAFATRFRLNKPWGVSDLKKVETNDRDAFVKTLDVDKVYWHLLGAKFNIYVAKIATVSPDLLDTVQQSWHNEVRQIAKQALKQVIEPFAQEARSMQALAEADTVLMFGTLDPKKINT